MSLATRNDYGTLYSLRVHKLKGITVLALIDLDKGLSITSNAANIIHGLRRDGYLEEPRTRIVYCDTDGRWDELMLSFEREFCNFKPIGATSVDEALARIAQEA
jgi:hypothetical protein